MLVLDSVLFLIGLRNETVIIVTVFVELSYEEVISTCSTRPKANTGQGREFKL